MGCVVVIVLIVIGIVAVVISETDSKRREREEARIAYQSALERLKRDPANADLRQETLGLGRAYANLSRNRRGVALFDEVALKNDMDAASAAVSQQKSQPQVLPKASVESRLVQLEDLRAKGLITEDEYAARRREILADV